MRIGAEVFGVDLTRPLGDAQTEALRRAIADHQVPILPRPEA